MTKITQVVVYTARMPAGKLFFASLRWKFMIVVSSGLLLWVSDSFASWRSKVISYSAFNVGEPVTQQNNAQHDFQLIQRATIAGLG